RWCWRGDAVRAYLRHRLPGPADRVSLGIRNRWFARFSLRRRSKEDQVFDIQEAVMEAVPAEKGVAVEVHELRKEFRRKDSRKRGEKRGERRFRVALDGVSFTMERGETVAILGQNGSGKSTLVRLLSTLLLHEGGTASILGHDVFKDARAVKRLVNRVSVEASFFKKMSAVENLSYAARFYGLRPHTTRERIPEQRDRLRFPT